MLDRLHRNPELANIPVIVLTARDPESTERKALEMGACAFFQKPADNGALMGVIRAQLAQTQGNANLPR